MRAVIADDSVLMREGTTRILSEGGIDVAVGVGDAPSLLAAVENCKGHAARLCSRRARWLVRRRSRGVPVQ